MQPTQDLTPTPELILTPELFLTNTAVRTMDRMAPRAEAVVLAAGDIAAVLDVGIAALAVERTICGGPVTHGVLA